MCHSLNLSDHLALSSLCVSLTRLARDVARPLHCSQTELALHSMLIGDSVDRICYIFPSPFIEITLPMISGQATEILVEICADRGKMCVYGERNFENTSKGPIETPALLLLLEFSAGRTFWLTYLLLCIDYRLVAGGISSSLLLIGRFRCVTVQLDLSNPSLEWASVLAYCVIKCGIYIRLVLFLAVGVGSLFPFLLSPFFQL